MECNKEEAIRAKGIADTKMQNRDFSGARKLVLKAQQLFPDLENVSQMLTVCEVHCSAAVKVNGETDWYGVLQVEPTADESTIKKQYRKLALLLHPDKNKFGGAEAAFKLVGEAHRMLSDKGKRSLHDIKRGASFRAVPLRQPTQKSNRPSCTKKQPGVAGSAANRTSTQCNGSNQQQPPHVSGAKTFWTMCPFCSTRYQHYDTIKNRALRCQNCSKPFIAYDLNSQQPMPSAATCNRTGVPQQENTAGRNIYFGAGSGMRSQGSMDGGSTVSEPLPKSGFSTDVGGGSRNKAKDDCKTDFGTGNAAKFEKVKLQEINKGEQAKKKPSDGNASQRRQRRVVKESNNGESSDSDVVVEGGHCAGQNIGTAESNRRRSTRLKQNISYNEHESDNHDDFTRPTLKRLRRRQTSSNVERSDKEYSDGNANGVKVQSDAVSTDNKGDERKGGGPFDNLLNRSHEREQGAVSREEIYKTGASSKDNATVDSSSEAQPDVATFSYPEPEFCDFEKERDKSKFAAHQIWAMYDPVDGMPRYYSWIKHVYGPEFKLWFSWLEYVPISKADSEWSEKDLPVGCGYFKLGQSQYTQDGRIFSHPMPWRKGTKKNSYEMYPRKGEVWALFKDWDIRWSSDADSHRIYEYEVVEVLSDFLEGVETETSVIHLVKVRGFVSLFVRAVDKGTVPLKIPKTEILRFSHKVPSYRMTGEEREGIPKDALELDAAALPTNCEEVFPSISLEIIKGIEKLDSACKGLYFNYAASNEKIPTFTTNKNSFQLNEKNVLEEMQSGRDLSSNRGNGSCEKEQNHSSRTPLPTAESQKHLESELIRLKQQVGTEKENVDARPLPSSPNSYEYPDSEFHDFEEGRSKALFENGQIWALYSDVDGYPKYYGWISKVDLENFEVQVRWLEAYTTRTEERRWVAKELPVGCGTFTITSGTSIFGSTDTFSHMVHAKAMGEKDLYDIFPSVGEVWAVYKNWNIGWKLSDLTNCEFDVVEILYSGDSGFKVLVLTKMSGYRAVFMPERIRGSAATMEIPSRERLRFSHRIPAFRLTEERGGKLRGYWELDPASVPEILLFANSN